MKDPGRRFGHQKENKEDRLFEIYLFPGINTRRYKKAEVEGLLIKYFSDYKQDRGATISLSNPHELCEAYV